MTGRPGTPSVLSLAVRICGAAALLCWFSGCWSSHGEAGEAAFDDGGVEDRSVTDVDGRESYDDAPDDSTRDDGAEIVEPPCVDEDGDGHPSTACGGDDCNDADPTVFPGGFDVCGDGRDTNCDDLDPVEGTVGPALLVLDHPPTTGNLYTILLWTGREYLFLWRVYDGRGIFMLRIDGAGKLVGEQVRLRTYENAFDAAWGGSRVGTSWVSGTDGAMNVMFQAFDHLGNPLRDAVAAWSSPDITVDGSVIYGPRIAPLGEDFVLLWSERVGSSYEIRLARVDAEGIRRGDPVTLGSHFRGGGPKLSIDSSGLAVESLWTVGDGGFDTPSTVYSRACSADLLPLAAEQVVDATAGRDTTHQALWTGTEFLALWSRAGAPDLLGAMHLARLDAVGAPISDAELERPAVGHHRYIKPAVWSIGRLAVLWDNGTHSGATGLTLSRYETDGTRHGESIAIPTEQPAARLYLAATGGEYGFIWSNDGGAGYRVFFQRATFCD